MGVLFKYDWDLLGRNHEQPWRRKVHRFSARSPFSRPRVVRKSAMIRRISHPHRGIGVVKIHEGGAIQNPKDTKNSRESVSLLKCEESPSGTA
jgi:hypothetical protein